MSIYAITSKLNEIGAPTFADTQKRNAIAPKQRGYGRWARSVVHRMLKNATYTGVWHYGKANQVDGRWTENPDDYLLEVEVPAIVSAELWEAAQSRLDENKTSRRWNAKHDYLLSGQVTCGTCGLKMAGSSKSSNGKLYLYYRCPGPTPNSNTARLCDTPLFRADHVDAVTWRWVRSNLIDLEGLDEAISSYQHECERKSEPLRERLRLVDGLLLDNNTQLKRLLDLYLSREFPKEMLVDRKNRLEATVRLLEKERVSLESSLERHSLTDQQIEVLRNLALNIADGLEVAEEDFAARRRIVELLDVQVILSIVDDVAVVCADHVAVRV